MMALTDLMNEYNCHYLGADSLSFFIDVNNICSLSLPTVNILFSKGLSVGDQD